MKHCTLRPGPGLLIAVLFSLPAFCQTSWKGTTSTNWATASNWTNGVPTSTIPAIIGDENFTGAFQPAISATASAKSLSLGGTLPATLTVSKTLTVSGTITISARGSLVNGAASVSLTGNWINNGNYTANATSSTVIFSGTAQTIGGNVPTLFRRMTINSGSVVSLATNITVSGTSGVLTVSGTLNPAEAPSYVVTADSITLNSSAVLKVTAPTFTGNYAVTNPFRPNAGSIIEYAATLQNQAVSSNITYSTLRISGAGMTKSLTADLPLLRATGSTTGSVYVLSGSFDLGSYAANRGTTVAGGTFSVSNGATVRIGGSNSFPSGFNTTTLSLTSTIEYNGDNQAVAAKTYGNLLLSSAAGAVVKTMPATAFTVAGSLTSAAGAGTGVSFTAAAIINVTGSLNIGASTIFNGGTFSHSITGNWNNSGTFTPGTSTITLKGAGATISGNALQNFYNLSITGSNVSSAGITDISVAGNLVTSGSGAFAMASPSTLTMTGTSKAITGTNITLNNLAITGIITTTTTATITGNISVTGSLIATSGTITMNGASKTISNAGTLTFRALLVTGSISTATNFNIASSMNTTGSFTASAGVATFTGSSILSGTVSLFSITINATSLTMASNAVLGVAGVFTITAGSLNVTTNVPNTVNYNGTGAQTIKGTTYYNLVLSNGSTKTAGAAITVNNDLTISTAATFAAASFTHTVSGNWINNGTFTSGTSTVQFRGATNSSISGASAFNNITVNKTLGSYWLTLLSNVTVATINMTLGNVSTASNTLTISTTRTGAGIILGTITRTHGFVTGTAYEFEGKYNTIIFTAISGVTSVTVNTTVGNVADFPFGGAVGRYYNISVPAGTYTATLRLHYEDAELNGNDESIMQLWRYNGAAWALSGKTSNNSLTNYVEKTGITNLTNRWSFTDDGSVLRWNGMASSDWSDGANWSLVHGTFSGAPTGTDIVELGSGSFVNQPVITNAASVKSLSFGSVQPVTLTLNTGGSLTTNGNIQGSWAANATHTINANNQNITINGNLYLSDDTTGHAINLNMAKDTILVRGSLLLSGNAAITCTSTGMLSIGKDFTYTGGSFVAGAGLVRYTDSLSQVVAPLTYNNLSIVKTAGTVATLSSPCTVSGNLSVSSGELDIRTTLNVSGSVTIAAGAVLDGNASVINVQGSWTASGSFASGNGTVNFTGANNQTISSGSFNALTFFKTSGTATLTGNNTINGDLSLLGGTLNLSTFTLNQSSLGDVFTMADGTTLLVGGANNFPSNFSTYSLNTNTLVHYNGSVAQSVADVPYGNISFSNGGTLEKTFLGSSTIYGNLTINNGASLNGGNFAITLNGNWVNNGGTFNGGTGDIILNGSGKTLTGNTTFADVTVNGNYSVASSDMTFNGHFQVTSTGSYTAGTGVATVNGDLTNSGSLTSAGTTTFTGNTLQTIRLINAINSTSTGIINFDGTIPPVFNSTTVPVFATLNINNSAGVNPSVGWTVLVAFNVSSGGVFNGGTASHTIARSFTNNGIVTSTGTLNFVPAVATTIQLSGTSFSSSGTVVFGGTGAITISGVPASLQDVVIANTNAAGITAPSAWTINGNLSINTDAVFNAGSFSHLVGGNIYSDGSLNGNSSTITMSSDSGQLSGSPTTTFHHLKITGSVTSNSDFNVDGDFIDNGSYDGSLGALIMTGNSAAVITGTTTPAAISQLTISKTAGAVVTANVNISALSALIINNGTFFTSTYSLAQDPAGGALIMQAGSTLKIGGTNSMPAFSGYGLDEQSTVDYAGTTQIISNGPVYGNLAISAAGNKSVPSFLPLTIAGNFILSAGNFVANNNTHKIAGNWKMTGGSFNNTNSVIRLNGSGNQDIQTTGPFNSINVNKASGVVTMSTDVVVNATLSFTSGQIKTGANTLVMGTSGTITGAAQATGWVNGNLQKYVVAGSNISRTFDIGGDNSFSPVTIIFSSVSTAGNLVAATFSSEHPQVDFSGINTSLDLNRYWLFGSSGLAFSTASATFNWASADVDAGASTSAFKVALYNGTAWTFPSSASPLSTSIQANALTSINSFAIGERATRAIWTGAAGTNDWFTPANWSGGVPGAGIKTQVPGTLVAGRLFPVIGAGVATVDTLVLAAPASLAVTNATLQIGGALINNGSFDVSSGTIEMNGSVPQTIPAAAFAGNTIQNLVINNNVTLAGQDTITGTLTIAGAGQTFATGGFLCLRSSAAATARVAPLPVNASGAPTSFITGNVTVERYIRNKRAWRLLTAPLSGTGTIFSSWQNNGIYESGKGMLVTGPNPQPANGLDSSNQNAGSMRIFNVASQAYLNVTNTKTTNLSNSTGSADNIGYFAFVRGDRSPANLQRGNSTATTLRSAGTLQSGKQVFAASGTYAHYTLIGNPYASPVDFNKVERTHLIKRFYTWDPTLNTVGAYVVLDDLDGDGSFSSSNPGSAQNKDIQSGQAFFVQTDTAGTASLAFSESSKSGTVSNAMFRPLGQTMSLQITLNLLEADNRAVLADAALAEFADGFCACVDLQDAIKFGNTNETFSLVRDGVSLAIERRPLISTNDTLFLRLLQSTRRNYQLLLKPTNIFQPNLVAFLEDSFTGESITVNLQGNTILNFSVTSDAASANKDRFRIVFKNTDVLPVHFTKLSAIPYSKNTRIEWHVANELDIVSYTLEKSLNGSDFTPVDTQPIATPYAAENSYSYLDSQLTTGSSFYRVRSNGRGLERIYSNMVEVRRAATKTTLAVYPNPVLSGTVKFQLTGFSAGKYQVRLLNALGQALASKELKHAGGEATGQLQLPAGSAKGMYQLEIIHPDGSSSMVAVLNE